MELTHIHFKKLGDHRGSLVAIEGERDLPFAIARTYFIWGTLPDVTRGLHAHKQLRQVAICLIGSCRFLMDDGKTRSYSILNDPQKGLLIDCMVWHEMDQFSSDCVLLVIASDNYKESDYIRQYSDFLTYVQASNI